MTDVPEPRKVEDVLKLEKALSDRSTCRATGEKIKKGEWRVGIEAWRAGRNTVTWQKAVPFLKNCYVEECKTKNSGICKLSGHKFEKGETRFVCSTGEKKINLTIAAAAEVIQPVIDAEKDSFSADQIKNLGDIPEADKKELEEKFAAQAGKRELEPAEPESEKPGKKRKGKKAASEETSQQPSKRPKRTRKAAKKGDSEEEEEEPEEEAAASDEEEEEGEPGGEAPDPEEEEGAENAHVEGDESEDEGGVEASQELPEYERQRQAIIARNKQQMEQLGLMKLAAELMPKQQPKPRTQPKGLSARKKAEPAGPRRTSARVQGLAADTQMIDQELRNGRLVLTQGTGGGPPPQSSGKPEEPEQPRERHSKEPLPFESDNGEEEADRSFLDLLKKSAAPAGKSKAEKGKVQLHKLELQEQDIAKVTSNGISHIQWHPSADHPIVAAADKSGNVGLWHVDHQSSGEGDDGVLSFKPHYSYVSGLRWAKGSKLFTASYDGSLRCLDPAVGKFELVVSSEDAEFSAFDCTPDGNVAILGDNDGYLHVFDVRENRGGARGTAAELHNKRVNTLHFAPSQENMFVSSSSDNSLAIWDLRSWGSKGNFKSLASAVHPKTCQSAYFAPDGAERVVSLSRDDTVKIWKFDGKARLEEQLAIRHNNNTGRWILPFRATWSPSGDAIVVGNMKRQVDIYSSKGDVIGALHSEHMTAISSRAAVHPERRLLAASTASGRVHIFRD